jgi:hypothetical protein
MFGRAIFYLQNCMPSTNCAPFFLSQWSEAFHVGESILHRKFRFLPFSVNLGSHISFLHI